MSLQAILAKIENDAKAEAERIIKSAKSDRKKALHQAKARIDEKKKRDLERIKRRVLDAFKQKSNHAKRETERALLSHRRNLVDMAIGNTIGKIPEAPDYLDLVAGLLRGCNLRGRVEVVVCDSDRSRINTEFLKKYSSEERSFVLADDTHSDHGGIIMRSGDISLNATLSMIVELNHDSMVMELSRLLPLEGQVG